MKRVYFLVPDTDTAKVVVEELRQQSVAHNHIHVIGSHITPLEGLPKASALQDSDLKYGVELGVGVGGMAGLIGGLLAVTFPPAGLVLGGGAILAVTLAGAGLGGLLSGLIAQDIPNHKLKAFEKAITKGELLLLVDVPRQRLDVIIEFVKNKHPGADIGISKTTRIGPQDQAERVSHDGKP